MGTWAPTLITFWTYHSVRVWSIQACSPDAVQGMGMQSCSPDAERERCTRGFQRESVEAPVSYLEPALSPSSYAHKAWLSERW